MTTDKDTIKADILDRMADGESLRSICRTEGYPKPSTVLLWLATDTVMAEQYARARDAQADALFDELEETAQKALLAETPVQVNALRLLVDTQKWRISKIVPKKYGDKTETEVTHKGGFTVTWDDGKNTSLPPVDEPA